MLDGDHLASNPVTEVDVVARGYVTMMRHLRFMWLRRRARRVMRCAAERGSPVWQREDLYDRA